MSLAIAMISREYPPFFGGGIGSYTERCSQALAAAGNRVVVITVSGDGLTHREETGGVVVVRLPFLNGEDWSGPHAAIATERSMAAFRSFSPVSVFAMQVAEALPGLVEEFELEVVEAPETGALAWFALNERRLGRPCGKRGWPAFLTHLHSPSAWIEQWDRAPQAGRAHVELKRMERDCVQWADGVLCDSRALAVWAEEHFELRHGSVEVIPAPLGDLETTPTARPIRAPGPRRIIYAGRLEPRKGVDLLLAGFALAVERGADLRLDLAGRDIHDVRTGRPFGAACLDRLVPPRIRARITVHGSLRPEALSGLRRSADLAAVPSPSDNFPNTCMEAMAEGLPVIAARAGGMAEMISGDGDGLLFEPGDIEGCAGALVRAGSMSDAELAEMGRAARERIVAICGTAAIIRDRIRNLECVADHGAARQCKRPSTASVPSVVIGGGDAAPLVAAVNAGAAFAHGWVRTNRGLHAFGTPTTAGLAIAPRQIGTIAIARSALERVPCGVDWRSPWEVAVALATAGEKGVVVPDFISDAAVGTPGAAWPDAQGEEAVRLCMELGPAMVAAIAGLPSKPAPRPGNFHQVPGVREASAEAELARIKASRGWRWLQRVYGILHRLKGRGGSGGGKP